MMFHLIAYQQKKQNHSLSHGTFKLNNMKITLNGQELDPTIEHEILAPENGGLEDFGFSVRVDYNSGTTPVIYNNVSEVHYLYNDKDCAIESNYHKTGSTPTVRNMEAITITNETEFKDGY